MWHQLNAGHSHNSHASTSHVDRLSSHVKDTSGRLINCAWFKGIAPTRPPPHHTLLSTRKKRNAISLSAPFFIAARSVPSLTYCSAHKSHGLRAGINLSHLWRARCYYLLNHRGSAQFQCQVEWHNSLQSVERELKEEEEENVEKM